MELEKQKGIEETGSSVRMVSLTFVDSVVYRVTDLALVAAISCRSSFIPKYRSDGDVPFLCYGMFKEH
jgi:hypothetical protein